MERGAFRTTLPKHFVSPAPVPYGCRGRGPIWSAVSAPVLPAHVFPIRPTDGIETDRGGGGEAENNNKIKVFRGQSDGEGSWEAEGGGGELKRAVPHQP